MAAYVTTGMTQLRLRTAPTIKNTFLHPAALKTGLLAASLPLHPFNNARLFLKTLLNTVTQAKYQE